MMQTSFIIQPYIYWVELTLIEKRYANSQNLKHKDNTIINLNPNQTSSNVKIFLVWGSRVNLSILYSRNRHQFYIQYYQNKTIQESPMNFNLEIIPFQERINPKLISKAVAEPQSLQKPKTNLSKIDEKDKIAKLDKRVKSIWTVTESKRYLKFLIQFQHYLELGKKEKRRLKLNVKMSKVIKSRDPSQCHSHHQKMLIKYGCVSEIINFLKSSIGETLLTVHKVENPQPKQVKILEKQCFDSILRVDFQLPPLFLDKRQEQQMELCLIQMESFQYKKGEEWDNCFI